MNRVWWGAGARVLQPIDGACSEGAPFGMEEALVMEGLTLRSNSRAGDAVIIPGLFTTQECDRLLETAQEQAYARGELTSGARGFRECYCAWLPADERCLWIYGRLSQAFQQANEKFRFEVVGIIEAAMALSYGVDDKIDWHIDTGSELAAHRKLSISVALNGPDTYDGGDLEITATRPWTLRPEAGTAVVFPSLLSHRVRPVTRGRRLSVVGFAHGPTFR